MLDECIRMTNGEASCDAYKWLRDLVGKYGADGMSSEESDNETGQLQPTLRVKVMPWRRDIDHELGIIDKQRKNTNAFNNQGSKPIHRERKYGNPVLSTRKPVPDLPEILYNREWLKGLDENERNMLGVTDGGFEWMNIAEAAPSRNV